MLNHGTPRCTHTLLVRVLSLLSVLAFVGGCGESKPDTKTPTGDAVQQTPSTTDPVAKSSVPAETVTLQFATVKEYEAVVAKLQGKVVLVDFWATWCAPCRQQFAHSVELSRKFQDQGLVVVSVSIDQLDVGESLNDLKTRVLDFLNKQHATIQNLVIPMIEIAPGDPAATDLAAERLDLPGGSIPHYKLFDRQGNLQRKYFTDPDTGAGYLLSEIDTEIEKLLNKRTP